MTARRGVGIATAAAGLALLIGVAVLTAEVAAADNLVLRRISALTRAGAPTSGLLADLSAALALGGSAIAGWVVHGEAARRRALLIATIAAGVWTLAHTASVLFSYAAATGQSIGSERFGSDLAVYIGTDLGIWMITGLVIAAVTTTIAVLGSSTGLARLIALLSALGLFAKAMTGHSAGDPNHEAATGTMLIHLLAVGLWVGGLIVLLLLPREDRDAPAEIRRYSHVALIAWVALAISGVWALGTRMTGLGDIITSAYVQIALVKAALLLVLGVIGALQRRELARGTASFTRLAVIEAALMGLATALAAALSSSPPPATDVAPALGPAAVLSGYALPPEPRWPGLLLAWRPDPFWIAAAIVLLLVWWRPTAPARPRRATTLLLTGGVLMVVVTNGPLNPYAKVLISAHLVEHVLLISAGALLAAAAPRTTLRWIPHRLRTGRVGPVAWGPVVLAAAAPLVILAVYAFPRMLRSALEGHAMHLVLQLLAVTAGVLLVAALRSIEQGGASAGAAAERWTRMLVLSAAFAPLLAGAVRLTLGDVVLLPSWFGATGRTWRADALTEQHQGALVAVILLLVLAGACAVVDTTFLIPDTYTRVRVRYHKRMDSAQTNRRRTVRSRPTSRSRSTTG